MQNIQGAGGRGPNGVGAPPSTWFLPLGVQSTEAWLWGRPRAVRCRVISLSAPKGRPHRVVAPTSTSQLPWQQRVKSASSGGGPQECLMMCSFLWFLVLPHPGDLPTVCTTSPFPRSPSQHTRPPPGGFCLMPGATFPWCHSDFHVIGTRAISSVPFRAMAQG